MCASNSKLIIGAQNYSRMCMCICIEFVIQVQKQKNAHVSFPVGMVFCVTDVCVCAIGELVPRKFLCNWCLQKVPHAGAWITQKNSCQKALCNRCPAQFEINSELRCVRVRNHLGSHSN